MPQRIRRQALRKNLKRRELSPCFIRRMLPAAKERISVTETGRRTAITAEEIPSEDRAQHMIRATAVQRRTEADVRPAMRRRQRHRLFMYRVLTA